MKSLRTIAPILALLLTTANAQAQGQEQIAYRVAVRTQALGFEELVSFPAFDPRLGELQGIRIRLDTWVSSRVGMENLADSPQVVRTNFGAQFALAHPITGERLAATSVNQPVTVQLAGYDGIADYAGSSGVLWQTLTLQETSSIVLDLDRDDRAAFIGPGRVFLPLAAQPTMQIQGGRASGVTAEYAPQGSAAVLVSYLYAPAQRDASELDAARFRSGQQNVREEIDETRPQQPGRDDTSTEAGLSARGGIGGQEAAGESLNQRRGLQDSRPRAAQGGEPQEVDGRQNDGRRARRPRR